MRAKRTRKRLFPSVNERETFHALGNFFRITFFEPSDFFESVSRDERVFESRASFFRVHAA
ncbi:hypothetical protein X265_09250 [Bradyrhizobium guangdongense]|nr:hypothetical protein X265_09250 [Bradyrhizobium guangdongense]